eukprot:gene4222-7559_t
MKQIIFSTKKNRKIYQQYIPEDILESWMLENSKTDLALDYPTHVSQKGGYYHIDSTLTINLIENWKKSIEKKDDFFMEEFRPSFGFRLFIDLDIKLDIEEQFDIQSNLWIEKIQMFTNQFFGTTENVCIITETHGNWSDKKCLSSKYKSGFRIYFPYIFINNEIYKLYMKKLSKEFENEKYKNQPKDWKMDDIFDNEIFWYEFTCLISKIGSCKWRRGNNLRRVYSFFGSFKNGKEMKKFTKYLNENMFELIQFTMIRLDNFKGKNYEKMKANLYQLNNSKHLEKRDINIYINHND